MLVVGCQFDIVWEDKPANFAQVRKLLATSAIEKGSLIVLPEMFATGFSLAVDEIAEETGGPTHEFLADLARQWQSYVIGGIVARDRDGRGLNRALVMGPGGELVAEYTKLHPFSFGGETGCYAAGSEVVVADVGEFRTAIAICYDLRFPELLRQAVVSGANLIVVIANWPEARDVHWQALLVARAIENQAYVVGVNRTGNDPQLAYAGHSMIVDPRGHTLFLADSQPQLLVADLDLASLVEYRRTFPALADMRPDLLGRLA